MRLYRKLIGAKLFNKVISIYTIIIVFVLVALTTVVLQNYSSAAKVDAANYSAQVVHDINKYLMQKISYVKHIQQLPYLKKDTYRSILQFFEEEYEAYSEESLLKKIDLDQYFSYACDHDTDINEIYALKLKDKSIHKYSHDKPSSVTEPMNDSPRILEPSNKKLFQPVIMPSDFLFAKAKNAGSYNSYTISINLRNEDFSKIIATVFINFDAGKLRNISLNSSWGFECNLMILNMDGIPIYDSSGIYSGIAYPGFDDLKSSQSGLIKQNDNITSVNINNEIGTVTACTIKNSNIVDRTLAGRRITLAIMLLCILAALILSYICMSFFGRRIKAVCFAMNKVKSGDFSQRIAIGRNIDEISVIAMNFNHMCDNLDDYISEVYHLGMKQKDAELKQKIAELYALQTQVNPHFLYNTLEAIRMKALVSGDKEVARMIYILGGIFRSSIKQEMIVTINSELEYLKSYLELIRLRYGESLKFSFDIDESINDYGIIRHLLQPLVENSVVHGMDPDKIENLIRISCHKNDSNVDIIIEDNGPGIEEEALQQLKMRLDSNITPDNGSIGIVNVNQRLRLIYGEPYGIDINSIVGKGTSINVKIPAKTVEELKQNVQSNAG